MVTVVKSRETHTNDHELGKSSFVSSVSWEETNDGEQRIDLVNKSCLDPSGFVSEGVSFFFPDEAEQHYEQITGQALPPTASLFDEDLTMGQVFEKDEQ